MARKKSRKKKKSDDGKLNLVLFLVIAVLCLVLFFRSEKGKEILEDFKNPGNDTNITASDTVNDKKETEKIPGEELEGQNVRVDFIDVGQGDSSLVKTPNGKYILVDAGPAAAKRDLVEFLENSDVEEIEYFILTHPHADHIGGASEVLSEFDVKNIIMPNVATTSVTFSKLLDSIDKEKKNGCKVYSAKPGDKYTTDDCNMTVLAPVEIDGDDLNNCSAVVKFEYKDFSVMFTGDAEAKSEKLILDGKANLGCDILKVGHHGSSTSTSKEFLEAVSPKAAMISCEKDNSYGHPHAEILQALTKSKIPYYITYECGSISVISDGKDFAVNTEKK